MEEAAILLVTGAIFVWGLISARLERADLTAPIAFTVVGAVVAVSSILSGLRRRSSLW